MGTFDNKGGHIFEKETHARFLRSVMCWSVHVCGRR